MPIVNEMPVSYNGTGAIFPNEINPDLITWFTSAVNQANRTATIRVFSRDQNGISSELRRITDVPFADLTPQ